MNYQEIQGNLIDLALEGHFDVIVQGCNCFKIMGKGLAKEVKERLPQAALADFQDERKPISRLGDFTKCQIVDYDGGYFDVVNLYTQHQTGRNADLTALQLCLRKMNKMYAGKTMGIPQIGCGIGGLDWDAVQHLIKFELVDLNVKVVIFNV